MASADFTIPEFLAWARTKPADEHYNFGDIRGCAVYQFVKAQGAAIECAGGMGYWWDEDAVEHIIPLPAEVLSATPTTFGALVTRLEALIPETLPSQWTKLDAYLADIEMARA